MDRCFECGQQQRPLWNCGWCSQEVCLECSQPHWQRRHCGQEPASQPAARIYLQCNQVERQWKMCTTCGCLEPFQTVTEECCWVQSGGARQCIFRDTSQQESDWVEPFDWTAHLPGQSSQAPAQPEAPLPPPVQPADSQPAAKNASCQAASCQAASC